MTFDLVEDGQQFSTFHSDGYTIWQKMSDEELKTLYIQRNILANAKRISGSSRIFSNNNYIYFYNEKIVSIL